MTECINAKSKIFPVYAVLIPGRSETDCETLSGAFWAEVWSSIALCFISIIISCVQIRYTLVLYKHMRHRQRE
ncbi:hypothetical protein Y032_0111g264 [Ancylostoma ceylanicum]|nr:hypothetical protein Y032_0111g264 [Ancylostoma ceylanicum]